MDFCHFLEYISFKQPLLVCLNFTPQASTVQSKEPNGPVKLFECPDKPKANTFQLVDILRSENQTALYFGNIFIMLCAFLRVRRFYEPPSAIS